jgi:hypothetical protein
VTSALQVIPSQVAEQLLACCVTKSLVEKFTAIAFFVIDPVADATGPADVRLAAGERSGDVTTGVIALPINGKAAIVASIASPHCSVV